MDTNNDESGLTELKLATDNIEVSFQLQTSNQDHSQNRKNYYKKKASELQDEIDEKQKEIESLDIEIDRLTNHADMLDNIVAVGSGILAGIFDSLWVGAFDMEQGKAWSNKKVNDSVMASAKRSGYSGDRLDGAIRHLEEKFKIPTDNIYMGQNIGVSPKSHHLDDFAHHPTPIGWFVSILTQFTEKGYFQNSNGEFFAITIDETGKKLIGSNFATKILAGSFNWFFHLVSDVSGNVKTAGSGMGIPGPIISLVKEAATIPGLNRTGLAVKVKEAYVNNKFDLRSELAVFHQLKKQALPVLLNEVIVRTFYFIRRLVAELKLKRSTNDIDWERVLPYGNRTITRMMTIATGTFTMVDMLDSAIRGGISSGGNPGLFAKEFLLRVNFIGVGRFAIAITTDIGMGIKKERTRNERISVLSEQLHLMNANIFFNQAGMWVSAESTLESINDTLITMNKVTRKYIDLWYANRSSMKNIEDYIDQAERMNPSLIKDILDTLDEE